MSQATPSSLDIAALARTYRERALTPTDLAHAVLDRIAARGEDGVWIYRLPAEAVLEQADALSALDAAARERLPLFGIPFAIKDNIDAKGCPTTAGCPEYAYLADQHPFVVERLLAAGAILIGKTNLDQFATGLVGIRTPYGLCRNPFHPDYIPGGSSSGSAVAVAAGLVSFALGTDTAGSGRVPAAFNNILGLKPTRGLISTTGVVPACRSLDCVSVFALTARDAASIFAVASGFDPADPFARPAEGASMQPAWRADLKGVRLAVPGPRDLEFFGDAQAEAAFGVAVDLAARQGADVRRIDFAPFAEAARLLYEGPWVAERYLVARELFERAADALHPVTRSIIAAGAESSAADAFAAQYRLASLRRRTEATWLEADALLLPTAGTIYTIAEVEAEPVALNANLGRYTNFLNLLDLCAVAVPAPFRADGLPFGVTLAAPAWHEGGLLAMAEVLHRTSGVALGATGCPLVQPAAPAQPPAHVPRLGYQQFAVCGAHMQGLPLNRQLLDLGAELVQVTTTSPDYRLYAFEHLKPERPGMLRVQRGAGAPIAVEVWALPLAQVGRFLQGVLAPHAIGTVTLADGSAVHGFLCEPYAIAGARDITVLGGWRQYLSTKAAPAGESARRAADM